MARPWEFPRWRRVTMQVTMWLVLGATLGLAQWISVHRQKSERVRLGDTFEVGDVTVRLPGDWRVVQSDEPPALQAVARTQDVEVIVQEVPAEKDQNAQQVLADQGIPFRTVERLEFPKLRRVGVLARGGRVRGRSDDTRGVQMIEGCVVLRPGVALVLHVEQAGARLSASSVDLLKRVAASVKWAGGQGSAEIGPTR